jgi:predicted DCC family thiol-disulfide oxidoreductase YuxK
MNSADRTVAQTDTGAIVVFDGACVLCNGWVRFLLKRDRKRRYRFAPMQGETGRRLLVKNGLDPDDPLSFLLIEYDAMREGATEPRASTDSDAVRRILTGLGGIWRFAIIAVLAPRFLRDPLYRLVARNRYRWFGRHESCLAPDPAEAARFL